jgi:hypothetical protein
MFYLGLKVEKCKRMIAPSELFSDLYEPALNKVRLIISPKKFVHL